MVEGPAARPRSGAGMHREHNGSIVGDAREGLEQHGEALGIIDVGWAVQRHEDILPRHYPEFGRHAELLCPRQHREQRIHHDVADELGPHIR